MRTLHALVAGGLLHLAPIPTAEARSFRVDQIPNGGEYECLTCHANSRGGINKNGFGGQVEGSLDGSFATGNVDWSAVYDLDGDGDGYSNGRELGDPEGTWTIGDPDPTGDVYNPGDPDDNPCGDGVLENPPEECDGDQFIDITCEDLGYGPGEVACDASCKIVPTGCEGYEPPEPENNTATNNSEAGGPTNNASTNNAPDSMTNGDDGEPSVVISDDDAGCCTTVSRSRQTGWFALFVVMLALGRRHRIRR